MRDFRKLKVWERAHQLTLKVYRASAGFPSDERFGLTAQIRRASVSIPSNLAEGCGRLGDAEMARFVRISTGSLREVEYQILLAKELGYLSASLHEDVTEDCQELARMLTKFLDRLRGGACSG